MAKAKNGLIGKVRGKETQQICDRWTKFFLLLIFKIRFKETQQM
jgi:hypothetical protein